MSRARTIFIRADNEPREGAADVAHVRVISKDGSVAYVGEVSGREDVADALHVGHITTMDPWMWVDRAGYSRPTDEYHG